MIKLTLISVCTSRGRVSAFVPDTVGPDGKTRVDPQHYTVLEDQLNVQRGETIRS